MFKVTSWIAMFRVPGFSRRIAGYYRNGFGGLCYRLCFGCGLWLVCHQWEKASDYPESYLCGVFPEYPTDAAGVVFVLCGDIFGYP